MTGFVIGIFLLAGGLYWLHQLKKKDIADCAAVLGLQPIRNPITDSGTTAEGFYFHEALLLEGAIEGIPARLAVRNVRLLAIKGTQKHGSHFTVLTLAPVPPANGKFRLQPRGVMSGLEALWQGLATKPTGNDEFDAAYRLHTDDLPATIAILTPKLQQELLEFRNRVAGPLPDSMAGKAAAGFLLGSIEVGQGTVSYHLFGSPTRKIAEHLKQAVPLLGRLASAGN